MISRESSSRGHEALPSDTTAIAAAVAITTAAVLPVFLVGGLVVQIRGDIAFDPDRLGATVTTYYAVGALATAPAGRFVQAHGARIGALLLGATTTSAVLFIALAPASWLLLTVGIALAGLGVAFAHPVATMVLADGVAPSHQGFGFGLKQAAVPAASLMSGLAVPIVGLTLGWRWAFALAAAVTLPLAIAVARVGSRAIGKRPSVERHPGASDSRLKAIALATALATATANSVGVFLVDAGTREGLTEGQSGLLLAAGALLSIIMRIAMGYAADKVIRRHMRTVTVMLVVGAIGYVLLAWSPHPGVFLVGTLLAFGGGWSWAGLQVFAVIRRYIDRAAEAAGILQRGAFLGGSVGPIVLGTVAARWGYAVTWAICAGGVLGAATLYEWLWRD